MRYVEFIQCRFCGSSGQGRRDRTYHPANIVIIPNPPATFSNVRECSAASGVVANPVWKFAAAMKAKRKMSPKNAVERQTFVLMEPRRNMALTIDLYKQSEDGTTLLIS